MRNGIHHPAIEHGRQAAIELRVKTRLIRSVPVQEARGSSIQRGIKSVSEGNGDFHTIGCPSVRPLRAVQRRVVSWHGRPLELASLARSQVQLVPNLRLYKRLLHDYDRAARVVLRMGDGER